MIFCFVTDGYSRIRTKLVDVNAGKIEIKNVAGFAYDYTNFQLVINGTAYALSSLTIASGNLNAGVDEVICITGLTIPASASIALFYPGALTPSAIVDFMQYGAAGHPHEADAVALGMWSAGDYIMGNPPYIHTGGATDEGVTHWKPNTMGLSAADGVPDLKLFPNPASDHIKVDVSAEQLGSESYLELVNMQGQVIFRSRLINTHSEFGVSMLPKGMYTAILSNNEGILEKNSLIIK